MDSTARATPDQAERLPAATRRLHRSLLMGLLETGAVPTPEAVAGAAGLGLDEVPARLRELAGADYLAVDAAGRVICLYPFSPTPTPHAVVIDGRRRYAMCAIDALGIAAMLGREVAIDGRCDVCGASIALGVRPGAVTRAEPATALVVARRDDAEPACSACCPFTLFACGPAHAAGLAKRMPGTQVMPLAEALGHAEALFGDLLGLSLPAARRRVPLRRMPLGGDRRWGRPDGG